MVPRRIGKLLLAGLMLALLAMPLTAVAVEGEDEPVVTVEDEPVVTVTELEPWEYEMEIEIEDPLVPTAPKAGGNLHWTAWRIVLQTAFLVVFP